jgi:hypothetical protein
MPEQTVIKASELGNYTFGDDVHYVIPIEFTVDGVACAVKLDLKYGGAPLSNVIGQCNRMTKTDFGNVNRPTTNDDEAKRAVKAERIRNWNKTGQLVPISILDKGAPAMTDAERINVMSEEQLIATMALIQERLDAAKSTKKGK